MCAHIADTFNIKKPVPGKRPYIERHGDFMLCIKGPSV